MHAYKNRHQTHACLQQGLHNEHRRTCTRAHTITSTHSCMHSVSTHKQTETNMHARTFAQIDTKHFHACNKTCTMHTDEHACTGAQKHEPTQSHSCVHRFEHTISRKQRHACTHTKLDTKHIHACNKSCHACNKSCTMNTCARAHVQTHARAHTHTITSTHSCVHRYEHTQASRNKHACTHACKNRHNTSMPATRPAQCTQMSTHAGARAYVHMHRHARIHTLARDSLSALPTFSSMRADTGRQLKQSVNVLHSLMLYLRLHSS
jgi:hypothetical protein